jgi:hypothetical protein
MNGTGGSGAKPQCPTNSLSPSTGSKSSGSASPNSGSSNR